jgi:hypothetical protein
MALHDDLNKNIIQVKNLRDVKTGEGPRPKMLHKK